jgi:hypothetical protein
MFLCTLGPVPQGFSHGPLAKQGDVGMVPLFMENMENMEKPPLKIGEVAETKIRPGFR